MIHNNIFLNADTSTQGGGAGGKKKGMSSGTKTLIIALLAAAFFTFILILMLSSLKDIGTQFGTQFSAGLKPDVELQESTLIPAKEKDKRKIALISIDTAIDGEGSHLQGSGMLHTNAKALRKAADDSLVIGVLINMNSPGGGLTASDVLHSEMQNIKDKGKPVVVFVGNLAASGGYYISAPADKIIASPTSLIGSIGVIMQLMDMQDLMRKIGMRDNTFKSGEMKDAGSPFRSMSPKEREYFQGIIDHYYARFLDIVENGRNISGEELRKVADGRIFTAQKALELKLVDEIGYFDNAIEEIRGMSDGENAALVQYKSKKDFFSMLPFPFSGKTQSVGDLSITIKSVIDDLMTPEVRLIWRGVPNN